MGVVFSNKVEPEEKVFCMNSCLHIPMYIFILFFLQGTQGNVHGSQIPHFIFMSACEVQRD